MWLRGHRPRVRQCAAPAGVAAPYALLSASDPRRVDRYIVAGFIFSVAIGVLVVVAFVARTSAWGYRRHVIELLREPPPRLRRRCRGRPGRAALTWDRDGRPVRDGGEASQPLLRTAAVAAWRPTCRVSSTWWRSTRSSRIATGSPRHRGGAGLQRDLVWGRDRVGDPLHGPPGRGRRALLRLSDWRRLPPVASRLPFPPPRAPICSWTAPWGFSPRRARAMGRGRSAGPAFGLESAADVDRG